MQRKLKVIIAAVLMLCSLNVSIVYGDFDGKTTITEQDIIYFIMTDRFENGDKGNDYNANPKDIRDYNGGDIQGIINKLDYIKDLGATAIWITPVTDNSSGGYHGYWAIDFYKVDEHLGDMNKLKELIQKAHDKDIKIILDLVVNHTSVVHPWVNDDKYADWYHHNPSISNWKDQEEIENGKLAGLPDLAQENPAVKKYLIDMAKWWIKETDIDGFRLDTLRHVPKDFWREFTSEIKKEYPNFYMLGEAWDGSHSYVSEYQKNGLSGMIDFPMYFAIKDVFVSAKKTDIMKSAIENSSIYENRGLYGTFIDNHDVSRFVNLAGSGKEQKLKQALMFQMTYTGIPIVYYGTEIAMEGSEDPTNRGFMEWSKQSDITDYIKALIKVRKNNIVFSKGDIKVDAAKDYFLAYERNSAESGTLVVFNTANKPLVQELVITRELAQKGNILVNVLDRKDTIKLKDTNIKLSLMPKESRIYMIEERSFAIKYFLIIPMILITLAIIYVNKNKK
jgi:alpha-amylase